ncbi:MAG: adenylate/guanylate cyclase domain-containing protein [Candidatus Binataceae bacterium]
MTENTNRCGSCGHANRAERRFCAECGHPLAMVCPACGVSNQPGEKFCGDCGAALSIAPAARPPSSAKGTETPEPALRVRPEATGEIPEGERKTVTALFADIKGSTELEQDLDPEEARAIIDPALKLMIEAVRRYDGYVVQSTGDGIFALFGAPVAHEDHPQRALYAALRMQEELGRYSGRVVADGGIPIEARIGANTGEVVVRSIATGAGHAEYTPIGHTTNLASRMQAVAPTGSIAISEATRRFVEGYFQLKPIGPTKVKGVSEPVEVFEVTGLGPLRTRLQRSAGRGLTKFVGRQREMDALKNAAEQARAGHGQIVAAVGEPGVGKSRLFYEFKAISQSGWMVLEAFSVSHGKASAFLPVIDLLWNYFRITSDDDERTRREKVNGKVVTLDRSLEDALPYLHALLGLSDANSPLGEIEPQTRKRRALEAIKRILLRESLNQPLIVIFEDLHWIDSESQAFLNLLADSIGTAKLLLLVNYRPEYRQEWGHKTYYTQLRLDPLGKESADEMLKALLGDEVEIRPLKRLIVQKTEGNPFFMEEMALVLFEEGALVREEPRAGTPAPLVKLTRSLNQLKIPPTVQAVLAARIDRLPHDEKELLQALAVIGTEFRLGLVQAVWQHPHPRVTALAGKEASAAPLALSRNQAGEGQAELERMLSELQLGEFIYEQPAVGDIEYTFKHALTHDVAYNSVLMERRRALHERIGGALESMYAESLDDHVTELAHHFARGGNPRKALEYCLRAVQQCVVRGSYAEAVAHFESGLELLQKLPGDDRRAELELGLRDAAGMALMAIKGYTSLEAEQSWARAMELCQRPGIDWEKAWSALRGVYIVQLVRPDLRKACEIAAEMIARAEEHGSAEHIADAATALAHARVNSGDFDLAAEGFDRAWALWESIAKPATGLAQQRAGVMPQAQTIERLASQALSCSQSAWNLWFLGSPDRSLERLNVATAIAHESGSKAVLEVVHFYATFTYEHRRELEHMRENAEATLVLSTESGNLHYRTWSEIFLGWAQAMAGDLDGGIARMRHHLSEFRATGAEIGTHYYLTLMATALGRTGRFDEALRTIDESFPYIERTGERRYEAEVHRLKGELLLAQDASNAAQAEKSFRTAIEISRKQNAKSWELRATTSLARLLAKQGKRDEAHAMLAEIYNWFTEGFDTADLKDAKALLDELGE